MKGTIKSKNEIERLFQEGRRSSSSFLTILSLDDIHDVNGRCAFIAGKKLGSAPFRSRCKRVLREVARELGAPWKGREVVFIARRDIAYGEHIAIVNQVRRQLEKLGIL